MEPSGLRRRQRPIASFESLRACSLEPPWSRRRRLGARSLQAVVPHRIGSISRFWSPIVIIIIIIVVVVDMVVDATHARIK